MGRLIPNIQPLLLEIQTKQSEPRAQESESAHVLSRLEGLEVSDATKARFERLRAQLELHRLFPVDAGPQSRWRARPRRRKLWLAWLESCRKMADAFVSFPFFGASAVRRLGRRYESAAARQRMPPSSATWRYTRALALKPRGERAGAERERAAFENGQRHSYRLRAVWHNQYGVRHHGLGIRDPGGRGRMRVPRRQPPRPA
jgi:hypothetical protein